jgi:hypothetical protein
MTLTQYLLTNKKNFGVLAFNIYIFGLPTINEPLERKPLSLHC